MPHSVDFRKEGEANRTIGSIRTRIAAPEQSEGRYRAKRPADTAWVAILMGQPTAIGSCTRLNSHGRQASSLTATTSNQTCPSHGPQLANLYPPSTFRIMMPCLDATSSIAFAMVSLSGQSDLAS